MLNHPDFVLRWETRQLLVKLSSLGRRSADFIVNIILEQNTDKINVYKQLNTQNESQLIILTKKIERFELMKKNPCLNQIIHLTDSYGEKYSKDWIFLI